MTLVELLTDPDSFFERTSENPSIWRSLLVVVVAAGVTTASAYPVLQATMQSLPPEASGAGGFVLAAGIVGGFLGVLVGWPVFTAVFHAISAIAFGGNGSFTDNLALVGWGHVPAVFSGIVSIAFNWWFFRDFEFPGDPQQMQSAMQSLNQQPEFQAIGVVGMVFTLWQGFLWVFAEKHARRISLREAAITVGIPVGLLLAWQVYNLL